MLSSLVQARAVKDSCGKGLGEKVVGEKGVGEKGGRKGGVKEGVVGGGGGGGVEKNCKDRVR